MNRGIVETGFHRQPGGDLPEQGNLDQIGGIDGFPVAVDQRQVRLALQIARCGVCHRLLPRWCRHHSKANGIGKSVRYERQSFAFAMAALLGGRLDGVEIDGARTLTLDIDHTVP